ncbi:MAG: hypothetical protein JF567_01050 [Xanthomonadales bacterium]|nr:hypothetical protein [Xanthomonadales bacterium]
MFKHTLLCGLVLGMTGAAALADAATTDRKTPQDSATSTEPKTSANTSNNQDRSLIMKAILIMHGGKAVQTNEMAGDSSNPECSKCHG